jgi:hypothetical protein
MNSTSYSDRFREMLDEALVTPARDDVIPRQIAPATPAEGASEQLHALLLMEGFGLPKPDLEPIRYHTILL